MPSQDTMLLLYPVMSKCGYPVSAYFPIKVNDVTIKAIKIQELSHGSKPILCQIGITVQIYCFCLKKAYLSLLGGFLSIPIGIFYFPQLEH